MLKLSDSLPRLQQVDQAIQTPNDDENAGRPLPGEAAIPSANSAEAVDGGLADPGSKLSPQPGADSSLGAATAVAAGATAGALAGPAAAVATIQAVGFSSAGIVGGSWAASAMSATAIASGGGVPAGCAVAVMQSIGALGVLPAGLAAAAALAGGAVLGLAGYGSYLLWRQFHPAAPAGEGERPQPPTPAPADEKGADAMAAPSPHDTAPAAG
jgi:hypothetical protein